MGFFDWNQNLALGVDLMDKEHQRLLSLMNLLYDANDAKKPKSEIVQIFSELKDYTIKHFADEEAYMDSIGFEGASSHKLIHKDLLEKLGTHFSAFADGPANELTDDIFNFLKVWLTAHIRGIDRKYADSVKKSA